MRILEWKFHFHMEKRSVSLLRFLLIVFTTGLGTPASGKKKTKSEILGHKEFAISRIGLTLRWLKNLFHSFTYSFYFLLRSC